MQGKSLTTQLFEMSGRLSPGPVLWTAQGESVNINDIACIRRAKEEEILIWLADGTEIRATHDYNEIRERFREYKHWVRSHQDIFVNLHHVTGIKRAVREENVLVLRGGREVVLTEARKEKVRKLLRMHTLDNVTPLGRPHYWILEKDLHDYEKQIEFMTDGELFNNFGRHADSGEPVMTKLLSNYCWQQANLIKAGQIPDYNGGNVRSIWYNIWPRLSRLGVSSNHYKTLSAEISDMVACRIISYKDFNLYDPNSDKWRIGLFNPHIIIMAEKEGHFGFLTKLQKLTGASIIANKGKPATITTEYFTTAFKEHVHHYWERDRVVILSFADYDPAGYEIDHIFKDDLRIFGVKHPKYVRLVLPESFTPEQLEGYKVDLHQSGAYTEKAIRKWIRQTGGINGEAYGVESDALFRRWDQAVKLVLDNCAPHWEVQPPFPPEEREALIAVALLIMRLQEKLQTPGAVSVGKAYIKAVLREIGDLLDGPPGAVREEMEKRRTRPPPPKITIPEAMDNLRENLATTDILDAVDYLDHVRYLMADEPETLRPPEARQQLLQLHRLAMDLVNYYDNDPKRVSRLYGLACDIELPLYECVEHLEKILDTLGKITDLGRCEDLPDCEPPDVDDLDWP